MSTVLLYLVLVAVTLCYSPSKADLACLGKCDQYKDYYCNPFIGVCEPCLFETDSPKCKEYFDSLTKLRTSDRPDDEPTSTPEITPQVNDSSDHEDTTPMEPVTEENDKGRKQPNRHGGGTNPQQKSNNEEKHTNVLIIVVTGSIITLCVGTVVKLRRRNRSPSRRGSTTVRAPGDEEGQSDEVLLQVGVDRRSGAAGETALPVHVEETLV